MKQRFETNNQNHPFGIQAFYSEDFKISSTAAVSNMHTNTHTYPTATKIPCSKCHHQISVGLNTNFILQYNTAWLAVKPLINTITEAVQQFSQLSWPCSPDSALCPVNRKTIKYCESKLPAESQCCAWAIMAAIMCELKGIGHCHR